MNKETIEKVDLIGKIAEDLIDNFPKHYYRRREINYIIMDVFSKYIKELMNGDESNETDGKSIT